MPVNGTKLIDNPFQTIFSPWTDLFDSIIGSGVLFWFVPIIILIIGVYIKTRDPIMTIGFMIVSGALFSGGGIFSENLEMVSVFTIFTALGITSMFVVLILQRKGIL